VIASVDDGYRFRAYVVNWRGSRVVVSDPLAETHHNAGDTIGFMVFRSDLGGKRLGFMTTGPRDDRLSGTQKGTENSSAGSGTSTEKAVVDEVLSAEDNGFNFTAYMVKWRGTRVAISEVESSHLVVGDTVNFLALRFAGSGNRVLDFLAVPANAERPAARHQPAPSAETGGVVAEVLTAETDERYRFRAYVVQWHGSDVVIADAPPPQSSAGYRVGDGIGFMARRLRMTDSSRGILQFEPQTAVAGATAPFAGRMSTTQDGSIVDAVLDAQSGEFRYVAYIVKWHGVRVAVTDMFSNSHYAIGDHICFTVSRTDSASGRDLGFMLFDFPRSNSKSVCSQ